MSGSDSAIKVSVVVPTYNTGEYVERCAASLFGQSMDAADYEVVYVDDGSTDDTPQRLRAVVAQHPNARLIEIEPSGWPGRPRNVGVQNARGTYVQFVDHDDELGHEALERMYAFAARNRADVLLGKMTSTMVRPRALWRRSIDACTVENEQLMQSLSPHKMFRRAFLLEHGLRFPEGRQMLEDMIFVTAAYLKAERIGVYADYPCYYWLRREDGGNNTAQRYASDLHYFDGLRTVLHQVKAATEPSDDPEALQNRLLRRNLEMEILAPAREPELLDNAPGEQRQHFAEAGRVGRDECPQALVDSLPAISRLRARLLWDDDFDAAVTLAQRARALSTTCTAADVRWVEGQLQARIEVTLHHPDGSPLVLRRHREQWLLDPALVAGLPGTDQGWPAGERPLAHTGAEVVVQDRERGDWWYPNGELVPWLRESGDGNGEVVLSGTVRLDPLRAAGGEALGRSLYTWWVSLEVLGLRRLVRVRLAENERPEPDAPPAPPPAPMALLGSGKRPRVAIPLWTEMQAQLALDLDQDSRDFLVQLAQVANTERSAAVPANPDLVELPLPVLGRGRSRLPVPLRIGEGPDAVQLSGLLLSRGGGAWLRFPATGPDGSTLPDGDHHLRAVTGWNGHKRRTAPLAQVRVHHGRVIRASGLQYAPTEADQRLDRALGSPARPAIEAVARLARRLPWMPGR